MKRTKACYQYTDLAQIKAQLLDWAQQFDEVVWLDSNSTNNKNNYDALLAIDAFTCIKTDYTKAFEALNEYQQTTKDWIFGYLTYDLKNGLENLISNHTDYLGFSDLYFFQPKKVFVLKQGQLELHYLAFCDDELKSDYEAILASNNKFESFITPDLSIQSKISKAEYLSKIKEMQSHINRGDIYEANFCQEFYALGQIDPLATFNTLNAISSPPFATFCKFDSKYVISASPERYIKKENQKILSSPIKGTAPRAETPQMDLAFAQHLANDPKERSENIMIVDLVRNDLSRIAQKGTVQVDELCKVYAFKQVHQMISTISCKLNPEFTPVQVVQATFPMGSMTGAPKVRAMQIIEQLETSKRGVYSGAVGYFTPENNFDFNVIIRTILYNAARSYISYTTGSAITAASIPEKEYEECLLKAKAMQRALSSN